MSYFECGVIGSKRQLHELVFDRTHQAMLMVMLARESVCVVVSESESERQCLCVSGVKRIQTAEERFFLLLYCRLTHRQRAMLLLTVEET